MPKKKQVDNSTETITAHVPFDKETWAPLVLLAGAEDRSIVATVRRLVREALAARSKAVRP